MFTAKNLKETYPNFRQKTLQKAIKDTFSKKLATTIDEPRKLVVCSLASRDIVTFNQRDHGFSAERVFICFHNAGIPLKEGVPAFFINTANHQSETSGIVSSPVFKDENVKNHRLEETSILKLMKLHKKLYKPGLSFRDPAIRGLPPRFFA